MYISVTVCFDHVIVFGIGSILCNMEFFSILIYMNFIIVNIIKYAAFKMSFTSSYTYYFFVKERKEKKLLLNSDWPQ